MKTRSRRMTIRLWIATFAVVSGYAAVRVMAVPFVNVWGQRTAGAIVSPVNWTLTQGFSLNDGSYHRLVLPVGVGQQILALSFNVEVVSVDTDVTVLELPFVDNRFLDGSRTIWQDSSRAYIGFDRDESGIRSVPLVTVLSRGSDLFLVTGDPGESQITVEGPPGFSPYAPPPDFGFGFVQSTAPLTCRNVFPFAAGLLPIGEAQLTAGATLLHQAFVIGRRRPDMNLGLENCALDHIDHYYLRFMTESSFGTTVLKAQLQRFGPAPFTPHALLVGQLVTDDIGHPQNIDGDDTNDLLAGSSQRYTASATVINKLNDLLMTLAGSSVNGLVNLPLYVADPSSSSQVVFGGVRISDVVIQCGNPGDLDCDGDVDSDDIGLITSALGPVRMADDPRDLDRDGRITVVDARRLVLSCTRPNCATH